MKNYLVKFNEIEKTCLCSSDLLFKDGDKVIVLTDRGEQLGIIKKILDNVEEKTATFKIKKAVNKNDYNRYLKNLVEAKSALKKARELVKKSSINMSIIDANYSLDKKFLVFNFVSDERIDFRELVKELAAIYHARIELRQVGVRDKAKIVGGIGMCGRELCCHNHLKCVNSINISMVKNQNIALNPTKINGVCGRLLCCFTYENDLYEENRKKLPNFAELVIKDGKEAVVTNVDVLNLKYTILFNDGSKETIDLNAKE